MTPSEEKLFILDLLKLNSSERMYSEESVINIIKQVLKMSKPKEQEKQTAEEILANHIDKESMDELSVNVWPDMLEAMEEYASQKYPTVTDEEVKTYIDNMNCGDAYKLQIRYFWQWIKSKLKA